MDVSQEYQGVYAAAIEIASGLRELRKVLDPILAPVVAEHSGRGHFRGRPA